ncbi:MAG: serine/threonine protein kinase [Deltaproteobacteria bacterium]|nr:serine/threonine protein kinase [Deltaproteobacteria bacterium]
MSLVSGMHIGRYELGRKLGEGGFGVVFQARDSSLDREVALKFLHPEHTANAEILRRFLQEARSAAKIAHPGIVTVFECGQVSGTGTASDGVAYIAMEMLHGESLSDRLTRAGRLTPNAAIEITRQVASALEAAHTAGIIHRDLKPDNIYLCRDPAMPSGERVKVLDFGIAKLAQSATSGVATRTQVVMGTPPYMSPEQCRSAAQIDPRSDIYTLGCILFELVCGRPPFDGEAGELIAKHQMVPPPTARSIISDLPIPLNDLIGAMLAKPPGDRPQTMGAVQRALGEHGGMGPTSASSWSQVGTPASGTPVVAALHEQATIIAGQSRTTLGGAAGQSMTHMRGKSRTPLIVAAVAVVAIGVGATWFATRGKETTEPNVAAAPQTQSPIAPPVTPAAPVPAPPSVTTIKLEIEATPKAEVWAFDGRLLGTTPYSTTRAPDEGQVVFVLKAAGYQDQRVEIPADQSTLRKIELVALVKPTAPITKPTARPVSAKPAKPVGSPPPPAATLKPGDIVID